MLNESDRRQLDAQGYLVLPGLMSPEQLQALRRRVDELFASEGAHAGGEFKQEPGARRLANLVNKGRIFEEAILTPRVLVSGFRLSEWPSKQRWHLRCTRYRHPNT